MITRADAVGGASIHVRDLAQAMIERGHEAVVFLGGEGPVTGQLAAAGVPFRSLRLLRRAIHPVRDAARVWRNSAVRCDDFRPDLVSAHTAKAGWIGRAACARLGLPVLYTPHGWSIGDRISAAHGLVFRLAERAAARWASGIICVSQYERELRAARGNRGSREAARDLQRRAGHLRGASRRPGGGCGDTCGDATETACVFLCVLSMPVACAMQRFLVI